MNQLKKLHDLVNDLAGPSNGKIGQRSPPSMKNRKAMTRTCCHRKNSEITAEAAVNGHAVMIQFLWQQLSNPLCQIHHRQRQCT